MEVVKNFPDSEILLNIRTRQNLDETIRTLYRSHFESLSWWVRQNSGTQQDGEDVFQEVVLNFIDLVQKDKFRGDSSIKTFLYSLNRHIWLNELKKRGRALAREEKYESGQEKTELDASQKIINREEKQKVTQLLEALGENCKKILTLFYYQNLPMKEIVEQTNYDNEQVVRNKKYKCLKQLEQMINENPILKETLKNLIHG